MIHDVALRVHGAAEEAVHGFSHARPVIIQVHNLAYCHKHSIEGDETRPPRREARIGPPSWGWSAGALWAAGSRGCTFKQQCLQQEAGSGPAPALLQGRSDVGQEVDVWLAHVVDQ